MASLTVRNLPEAAKLRFRQVAAAHGRSMEEHLRQLVIDADFDTTRAPARHVADAPLAFRHQPAGDDGVGDLLRAADGGREDSADRRRYDPIRFMTAKDAMAELRRLANGVGLDLPPRLNTTLEAPEF